MFRPKVVYSGIRGKLIVFFIRVRLYAPPRVIRQFEKARVCFRVSYPVCQEAHSCPRETCLIKRVLRRDARHRILTCSFKSSSQARFGGMLGMSCQVDCRGIRGVYVCVCVWRGGGGKHGKFS